MFAATSRSRSLVQDPRPAGFPAESVRQVIIGIGHAGRLAVERGLVRPEDMPQAAPKTAS
jgi:hypothetical protein